MPRILKIAQREYVETVKTKTFILGLLLTPVIIGIILFFSSRVGRDMTGPVPPRKIAVTDLSNELGAEIKASFDEYNASHPERQIILRQIESDENDDELFSRQKQKVRSERLNAYFLLAEDSVQGRGEIRSYTRSKKMADLALVSTVENILNRVVVSQRCRLRGLSPGVLADIRRRVPVERIDLGADVEEKSIKEGEQVAEAMVSFFFMFLMFMGIFGTGQGILSSVIEEKSSRVIEVLLSAVSPFQIMAGKIIGLAGISLTVITLWATAALGTAHYASAHLWGGININIPTEIIPYFIIYFVLGFLMFSSILAGIGSVCNTIKEAQSLMMPITMMFVVPMVAWMNLAQHPDGTLARVLSFLPPLTPMVMVLRLASSPHLSVFEITASIIVLAAFVPVVMWLAARVFRTGILMYGKRPGLREVLRWLRQS